jgi:hypothetical protein
MQDIKLAQMTESAFASQNVEPPATVPRIQPARTAKKTVNVFSHHLQTAQPPSPVETVKAGDARSRSLSTIVGTGPAVASIRLAEPRFWLYVSNLNPASDDEDLMKYLKNTFGTDNIKCVKLLPDGRDVNSCEFVSFKLGFPLHMKEEALSPSSWPEGFTIREFFEAPQRSPHRYHQRGRRFRTGRR